MAWRIKSGKFHTFPFDAHAVRQRFNSSNNGTLRVPFFLRRDLAVYPYSSGRAGVEPSPRSEETGYAG